MKAGCCISEPAQISGTFEFIRECLLMIQPLAAIVTSTDVTCIVSFCVHNLINYNKVTRSHVQPVFIEGLPLASREQNRHKSLPVLAEQGDKEDESVTHRVCQMVRTGLRLGGQK